jgi:hypothetical protein
MGFRSHTRSSTVITGSRHSLHRGFMAEFTPRTPFLGFWYPYVFICGSPLRLTISVTTPLG